MNCQCHILDVKWYDFVTNESICTTTGLADIRDIIRRRRLGLVGYVARFDHDVPAASALAVCCISKDFTPPDSTWRRPRGHPWHTWLCQVCSAVWHVGHWCSDTGTGQRFVESSRYGLRARRTMMMMSSLKWGLTHHPCSCSEWNNNRVPYRPDVRMYGPFVNTCKRHQSATRMHHWHSKRTQVSMNLKWLNRCCPLFTVFHSVLQRILLELELGNLGGTNHLLHCHNGHAVQEKDGVRSSS